MGCPISVTTSSPQAEIQAVLRQLVAVCVFLFFQAFLSEELQCGPGSSTQQLENLPGNSFARWQPLVVELW